VYQTSDTDVDRLAAALAHLLAQWWRSRERQLCAESEGVVTATLDPTSQAKAPAPTGAGEIHPEHHTRKDTTS